MSTNLIEPRDLASYSGPPLFLFLGISTAGSSIHELFPHWAPAICPGAQVRGVDLSPDAPPEAFRRLVGDMAENPRIRGAVVTSHKVRLHAYCRDLFDSFSPLAELAHEVNSINSSDGLRGFATDPVAIHAVIDEVQPPHEPPAPLLCLGSGGSAAALALQHLLDIDRTLATAEPVAKDPVGSDLTIVARRASALPELEVLLSALPNAERVRFAVAASSAERTELAASQPPGTVVINATGLGKTEPGSPLAGPEGFPARATAWDFNYRGPLTFLDQARAAGVRVVDGWEYFLAGWSTGLTAVEDLPALEVLRGVREASGRFRPGQG